MRFVFRVLAMAAALAFTVGCGRSAFAQAKLAIESQIQHWSEWWLIEVGRHPLPVPQLLSIGSRFPAAEADLVKLEPNDGPLSVIAAFKVVDPNISEGKWHLGLLTTEALIPPPNNQPVYAVARSGPSWARLQLAAPLPWCGLAEFSGLKPVQKNRNAFSWPGNIRAPASIGSIAFSDMHLDGNPFHLNIPKRLSVYGEDLRLFEFSLHRTSDDSFGFGNRWTALFFRWSPPELDEMFSTPLPASR